MITGTVKKYYSDNLEEVAVKIASYLASITPETALEIFNRVYKQLSYFSIYNGAVNVVTTIDALKKLCEAQKIKENDAANVQQPTVFSNAELCNIIINFCDQKDWTNGQHYFICQVLKQLSGYHMEPLPISSHIKRINELFIEAIKASIQFHEHSEKNRKLKNEDVKNTVGNVKQVQNQLINKMPLPTPPVSHKAPRIKPSAEVEKFFLKKTQLIKHGEKLSKEELEKRMSIIAEIHPQKLIDPNEKISKEVFKERLKIIGSIPQKHIEKVNKLNRETTAQLLSKMLEKRVDKFALAMKKKANELARLDAQSEGRLNPNDFISEERFMNAVDHLTPFIAKKMANAQQKSQTNVHLEKEISDQEMVNHTFGKATNTAKRFRK